MTQTVGAIVVAIGLIGGLTALVRDWKTAPKAVMGCVAVVGLLMAAAPSAFTGAGRDALGGSSGQSPTPSGPTEPDPGPAPEPTPTPTLPPVDPVVDQLPEDPSSSEEYLDCHRNAGYGVADCEILRDEQYGEAARSSYALCRQSGYDTPSCLEALRSG